MASPLRVSEELVRLARTEAALQKRTVPRQIEFWAELGRRIEGALDATDVIAICQGLATLHVSPAESAPVEPDEVFAELDRDRRDGRLAEAVTTAVPYYEASRSRPGLLDRVYPDGRRETGMFRGGEFEPMPDAK